MPTYSVINAGGTAVLRFNCGGSHTDALLEAKRQILRSAATPANSGVQHFDLMLATELVAKIEVHISGVLEPWATE